ncbi:zinc-binding oxidoreductase CipB [Xylariales sp. AK1849]|nr:zinc-binding oxidoreductase CipB [Xylariales sp. AK1849]
MPENKAAYLEDTKVRPLVVRPAPYTSPKSHQIVIRNAAIALNPLDHIKQDAGNVLFGWIKYPFVMGSDVAGVVIEVGPDVTRFKVGDRVISHATGMEKKYNTSAMSGFQLYTAVQDKMTSKIPDSLEFEQAAVLPLALSTASCGLFEKDQLALRYPSIASQKSDSQEVVLIWGGSSSVGCNAIQLATAAGYEVITTCSPRNFDLVKSLGATVAFDYRSKTIVDDITSACKGKKVAGALSIGNGGAESCTDILGKCQGTRFISMVSYPSPTNPDAGIPIRVWTFISFAVRMYFRKRAAGVTSKFVWGGTLEDNELGQVIYEDYLPQALSEGNYICAPKPQIIGKELEAVQSGLDMLRNGVSAKKLVVKF